MDGISIASAVVAFVEAGVKIKKSISKVSQNNRRMRELSEDIVKDLNALKTFCDKHKQELQSSAELRDSVGELQSQLFQVSSLCERAFDHQGSGLLNKLKATYISWRNAHMIEIEVTRLRDNIQSCLRRVHLYASARSELVIKCCKEAIERNLMATARTEQTVLVLKTDLRYHIHRFDTVFGETVTRPSTSNEFISILGYSELDFDDLKYLRFKLHSIAGTLETYTSPVSDVGSFEPSFGAYVSSRQTPEVMTIIESRLAPAWRVIHALNENPATSFIPCCLEPVLELAYDITGYDFDDIIYRIFDIGASILRQVISTCDDDNILLLLSWVLQKQYCLCPIDAHQVALSENMTDIRRKLFQSPRETYPKSLRLLWLQHALLHSAYAYTRNGDINKAISQYREALCLTHSLDYCGLDDCIPITCEVSGVYDFDFGKARTFTHDHKIVQAIAYALLSYAKSLHTAGRHSEARDAGQDSINIIQAIQARANDLPQDFDLLADRLQWIKSELASWDDNNKYGQS